MVHIVEDFKADSDRERSSVMDVELVNLRKEKKQMDGSYSMLKGQATKLSKRNSTLVTQVNLYFLCFFLSFFSQLILLCC